MERITLIETDPSLPGFNQFIGTWLCSGRQNILIDVGPMNTVGTLIRSLSRMGVHRIDYVLLTHIHIDHSGGLAPFLEHYPMATVICHEKAVGHLTAPSRLWKASQQTLGHIGRAYGAPQPVPLKRLIPHTQIELTDLDIIETPGHASHHLSFSWAGHLFAGEAAGNYYTWESGEYLRPATPPRFFENLFLSSVDRLFALDNQPICYSHFGRAENSRDMLARFRRQILRWHGLIQECMKRDQDLIHQCVNTLLETDPELSAFRSMKPAMQDRERYFIENSVRGFVGFLSG